MKTKELFTIEHHCISGEALREAVLQTINYILKNGKDDELFKKINDDPDLEMWVHSGAFEIKEYAMRNELIYDNNGNLIGRLN